MDFTIPEFWSVVIALLAFVFSQLPPISDIIKRTKVKLVIPDFFGLYHHLGNVNINLFVDVHNVGGKVIHIAKLECVIRDTETGRSWRLTGRTYYSRQSPPPNQSPTEFFIGTIAIKPGEHWSETIHFYNFWTRPEEERVNEITTKIRSNMFEKSRKLQQQQQPQQLLEADEHLVKEAWEFFEKKYNLTDEGNYQFFVAAFSDAGRLVQVRGFEFTLFKGSVQALKSAAAEDYKYGAGIYYPSTNPAAIIWMRIRPMEDEERAKQIYQKI